MRSWENDVEDWMGGKCLESGTNSRRSADVGKIHQGRNVRKERNLNSDKVKLCTINRET